MNIRKDLLLNKILAVIARHYKGFDKALLTDLCRKVILHNPGTDCVIKGLPADWDGLPANKSLSIRNINHWISSVNSYLGLCRHYNTYRFRERLIKRFKDDFLLTFDKPMCVVEKTSSAIFQSFAES